MFTVQTPDANSCPLIHIRGNLHRIGEISSDTVLRSKEGVYFYSRKFGESIHDMFTARGDSCLIGDDPHSFALQKRHMLFQKNIQSHFDFFLVNPAEEKDGCAQEDQEWDF